MSQLLSQTLQASVLSATSNILAQALSAYRSNQTLHLHLTPILKFVLFAALSTPPNCLWQSYLESSFPTRPTPPPRQKGSNKKPPPPTISIRNVVTKLLLDQTISAGLNTILFLAFMGYANANGKGDVKMLGAVDEVREKFGPLMWDGYKLWPAFAVVSFVWIPVERRVLLGSLVGVAWGIYLSLLAEA